MSRILCVSERELFFTVRLTTTHIIASHSTCQRCLSLVCYGGRSDFSCSSAVIKRNIENLNRTLARTVVSINIKFKIIRFPAQIDSTCAFE